MKLQATMASAAASRVTTTAWSARLPNNAREDAPSALRTAKSRTRCRADTYSKAATMMAATSHIMIFELLIDEIAPDRWARSLCSTAWLVSTSRPGGTVVGMPCVTTAVTRGALPRPRAWASCRLM